MWRVTVLKISTSMHMAYGFYDAGTASIAVPASYYEPAHEAEVTQFPEAIF